MRPSFADTGIIVRSVDSGEADKFVSIITENHGLQDFLARGARRLTSKKAPHLDLFNLVKFQTGRGDQPQISGTSGIDRVLPGNKKGLCQGWTMSNYHRDSHQHTSLGSRRP